VVSAAKTTVEVPRPSARRSAAVLNVDFIGTVSLVDDFPTSESSQSCGQHAKVKLSDQLNRTQPERPSQCPCE
jgi:hypothetical protein